MNTLTKEIYRNRKNDTTPSWEKIQMYANRLGMSFGQAAIELAEAIENGYIQKVGTVIRTGATARYGITGKGIIEVTS